MASVIRPYQRALTALLPHQGNSRYAVPKRTYGADGKVDVLYFDSDTFITTPVAATLASASAIEVEFWVDQALATNGYIITSAPGTSGASTYCQAATSRYRAANFGGTIASAPVLYSTGTVYKVKWSWQDAANMKSSGGLGDDSETLGGSENAGAIRIGDPTTSAVGLKGYIRNVKVYDTSDTLIHHWPINEGTGTVIKDVVGGDDGTLTFGTGGEWQKVVIPT